VEEAQLIDELGHEQVDVLGLSWGGALAQELVRRHPHRVRRLVLVATMHGWTSLPGRPTALTILASPLRYYSQRYLTAVAPMLYGKEIIGQDDLLRRHAYVRASKRPSMLGYTYQLAALRRWTSLPWLHAVHHPTLVLAGDDDPIIPLVNARVMVSRLPQGRMHVVKGGGHLFLFIRAAIMAETVLAFLDAGDPIGTLLPEERSTTDAG
jgi:poly(3-hydroxyoctanoate) depolymerase